MSETCNGNNEKRYKGANKRVVKETPVFFRYSRFVFFNLTDGQRGFLVEVRARFDPGLEWNEIRARMQ